MYTNSKSIHRSPMDARSFKMVKHEIKARDKYNKFYPKKHENRNRVRIFKRTIKLCLCIPALSIEKRQQFYNDNAKHYFL